MFQGALTHLSSPATNPQWRRTSTSRDMEMTEGRELRDFQMNHSGRIGQLIRPVHIAYGRPLLAYGKEAGIIVICASLIMISAPIGRL